MNHVVDVQVLNNNMVILVSILLCRFEVMVTALTLNLQMGLRRALTCLTASTAALLASADRSLLASERGLRRAIVPRVVNGIAFAIGQKRLEANINTDISMGTLIRNMLILCCSFAHNKHVPVSISTKHKMRCLGCSFHRTMQLDFHGVAQLVRNVQMLLIMGKHHITTVLLIAILSQLNTM